MSDKLRFLIPNGSLFQRLLMYLALAGYGVDKPDRRGYCGLANGVEFWVRDRRMVVQQVARPGTFDAGITGLDLILDSEILKSPVADQRMRMIAPLCFSRSSDRPSQWVLAMHPAKNDELLKQHPREFMPVTVGCELPGLARYLDVGWSNPYNFSSIVRVEGNEEMAIQDGLCEAVLVVTETGGTLREVGLKIVSHKPFISTPQIIAKPVLAPEQEEALQQLRFALETVISASTRVMVKADLPTEGIRRLQLPAEVSPTVSPLDLEGWSAVELCIPRSDIGPVGLKLERAGARGIVVQEVIGYCAGKAGEPIPALKSSPSPAPMSTYDETRGGRH